MTSSQQSTLFNLKMYKRNNFKLNITLIFIVTETKLTRSIVQQNITARMIIVRVNIVCLCVLAFACCAESGCSCGPQHPQQALCDDNTFGEYCICFWIMYSGYLVTIYWRCVYFQIFLAKINLMCAIKLTVFFKWTGALICAIKAKRTPPPLYI